MRLELCRATRRSEDGGNPRVAPHTEDSAGQVEPQPLSRLLSLSPGFTDKWGSGRKRQGKVEDPVFL